MSDPVAPPPPPKPLPAPEPLNDSHVLGDFDCGNANLTDWLKKNAGQSQRKHSAQTYVVHRDNIVIGYYSLAAGSVAPDKVAPKIAKGLAQSLEIPIMLLARLAVDKREQGTGIGKGLLQDALLRILGAADQFGIRAVVVDAIDGNARAFYLKHGFEASPIDEFRLMLLIQDIKDNAA